jgi:hypothetical protein
VFRGWEYFHGTKAPWQYGSSISRNMDLEFAGYCQHQGGPLGPTAPATLVHPDMSILQHPYGTYFAGTPQAGIMDTHPYNSIKWIFSVFRGCQPAMCTFPQDADEIASSCERPHCAESVSGKAAGRAFIQRLPQLEPARFAQCVFPATPEGQRKLIAAQNFICDSKSPVKQTAPRFPDGSGWECDENQHQIYWSGHSSIVALAIMDRRTTTVT